MLSSAALVCTDGNIPSATIEHICNLCHRHNVPGQHSLLLSCVLTFKYDCLALKVTAFTIDAILTSRNVSMFVHCA